MANGSIMCRYNRSCGGTLENTETNMLILYQSSMGGGGWGSGTWVLNIKTYRAPKFTILTSIQYKVLKMCYRFLSIVTVICEIADQRTLQRIVLHILCVQCSFIYQHLAVWFKYCTICMSQTVTRNKELHHRIQKHFSCTIMPLSYIRHISSNS